MATVNRYTQTENTTYEPRTLQELMLVPAYKRKQHDELNAGIAEYETELAQKKALGIHDDLLSERQNELYKNMINQRDKLEGEGFSQSAKSDFIRFNKQYQQAVGPQGDIGRIGAAETAMGENKNLYISNAVKDGYSPKQAELNWDAHQQNYATEFEETGKVSNIDELYAPKYVDYLKEGREYFKDAGLTGSDITTGSGAIKKDAQGSYVVNSQHREATSNNIKQLQAAADFLNNQIKNKNSDMNRSIIHQGKTAEDAINDIIGMKDIYEKSNKIENTKSTINSYTPLTKKEDDTIQALGLTAVSTRYDNPDTARDYQATNQLITDLSNIDPKDLTQDDKVDLQNAKEYKKELDIRLSQMPGATPIIAQLDNLQQQNDALRNGTYQLTDEEKVSLKAITDFAPNPEEATTKFMDQLTTDKLQQLNELNTEMAPYMEEAATDIRLMTNNYAITPDPNNPKGNVALARFKTTLGALVQSSPGALNQNANILRVTDEEGNSFKNLSSNDLDNISALVYNAEPGDLDPNTFTPTSVAGVPGYTIKVKVKESYNLDGNWKPSDPRDDTIGGEGKYILVDVTFDKLDNGIIRNINGFAQDYLNTVGPDGKAMVQEMNHSITRHDYRGNVWDTLIKEGVLDKTNEDTFNYRLDALYRQQIKKYLERKGIIDEPTAEEYEDAKASLKNTMIQ